MTAAAAAAWADSGDLLEDYRVWVSHRDVTVGVRRDRIWRARRFLVDVANMDAWMRAPTRDRLTALHRHKAWPFMTWLFVSGRIRPDIELILSKPPGVDLPAVWAESNRSDVELVTATALEMGWRPNWVHQIAVMALSMVALRAGKTLHELTDADFDSVIEEVDQAPGISASARGGCTPGSTRYVTSASSSVYVPQPRVWPGRMLEARRNTRPAFPSRTSAGKPSATPRQSAPCCDRRQCK